MLSRAIVRVMVSLFPTVKELVMISVAPGWELSWEGTRDWLFVKIRRNGAEADGAPPLAQQIWDLAEQTSVFQLVLELDEIDVLFSYLIGQLIMLHKRVWAKGGKIRLCGLSQRNQETLYLCRLDDRFPSYPTRQEAVSA
jgi:anti-anti-sigma factor